MMDPVVEPVFLSWPRLVMLALFTGAFLLYVWNVARLWTTRTLPANLLAVGFLGVLSYVAGGQIKAAAYGVRVDALTYFGGAAAVTVITALALLQHRSRTHEGA